MTAEEVDILASIAPENSDININILLKKLLKPMLLIMKMKKNLGN